MNTLKSLNRVKIDLIIDLIGVDNWNKIVEHLEGEDLHISRFRSITERNRQIRQDYISPEGLTQMQLSQKYDISLSQVKRILKNYKEA